MFIKKKTRAIVSLYFNLKLLLIKYLSIVVKLIKKKWVK